MDFQELFQGWQSPEKDIVGKTYDLYKKFEEWKKPKTQQEAKALDWIDKIGGMGFGTTIIKDAKFHTLFDKAIEQFRNSGDAGWKSRSTLVSMKPSDFLKMAEPLSQPDPDKMARVLSHIREGKPFTLPELDFYRPSGVDVAEVMGHEGRHRAMAMRNLGWDDFPVRFNSQLGMRWGELPKDFVYPKWLQGQEENFINRLPFPKSLFDY
jgi:hypothetical protein